MDTATPVPESAKAEFQSIPVDQIKPSQHQARKAFDEESIKGLAESMKQETLLQPISVRRTANGYELISGERRLRAAKLLGWSAIDAKVIKTVSEGEAAAKGLIENLQREDLNPIEEAEGFNELNRLDPGYWSQDRIAKISGRTPGYISQSFKFLNFPEPVKDDFRRLKLSRSHGVELLQLKDPAQQEKAADLAVKGGLSIKQIRQLVDKLLGKDKTSPSSPSSPSAPSSSPALIDPLADVWYKAQGDSTFRVGGEWEVSYGRKRNALGTIVEGWTFHVCPTGKDAPAALAIWFKKVTDALAAAASPEAIKGVEKGLNDYQHLKNDMAEKVLGHPVPPPPKISPGIEAAFAALPDTDSDTDKGFEPRLPKNDQEQAELEALAAGSPSPQPVYTWIYGPNSPLTKMMQGRTWSDFGPKDPKEGLKKLLEGVKMAKEHGL